MIEIKCSEEEYEYIIELIKKDKYCGLEVSLEFCEMCEDFQSCEECARKHIKRVDTDITPNGSMIDRVNSLRLKTSGYSTVAAENAALQAYNQAKKDFIELLGGEQ